MNWTKPLCGVQHIDHSHPVFQGTVTDLGDAADGEILHRNSMLAHKEQRFYGENSVEEAKAFTVEQYRLVIGGTEL